MTRLRPEETRVEGQDALDSLYADWRLPNVKELLSIVDYGREYWFPSIDPSFPGDTAMSSYWSATIPLVFGAPTLAYCVFFREGYVDVQPPGVEHHVRAVRSCR